MIRATSIVDVARFSFQALEHCPMAHKFEVVRYRPKNAKTERTYVAVSSGTAKPTWLPLPQATAIADNLEEFVDTASEATAIDAPDPAPAASSGAGIDIGKLAEQLKASIMAELTGTKTSTAKTAKTLPAKPAPLSGAAARVRSARR